MSGATWILVRGLTREARHWGTFTATFAERMTPSNVVAIDLPGNGELHRVASPLRVDAMADRCRAELQRRGIVPPVRLLAMSLGAMVASAWVHLHPQEISAAVLINTSMRPFNPFTQRLRPASYAALLRLALTASTPVERETVVRQLTSRLPGAGRELIDEWAAHARTRPVSAGNAMRQLWAAARYRAPRTAPTAPVLLLSSAMDGLVDPRCSMALARAWNVPIAVHPWAGHDLPLDDAGWVVDQVATWLQRLPVRSADS